MKVLKREIHCCFLPIGLNKTITLIFIMKWVLWMVTPPVLEKKSLRMMMRTHWSFRKPFLYYMLKMTVHYNANYTFASLVSKLILTSAAPQNEYFCLVLRWLSFLHWWVKNQISKKIIIFLFIEFNSQIMCKTGILAAKHFFINKFTVYRVNTSAFWYQPTWKLCVILSGLKLLGITTTPLWALKRKATWALLLLYFFPMDTSSSSSSKGGHFKFTLKQKQKRTQRGPWLRLYQKRYCLSC